MSFFFLILEFPVYRQTDTIPNWWNNLGRTTNKRTCARRACGQEDKYPFCLVLGGFEVKLRVHNVKTCRSFLVAVAFYSLGG